MYVICLVLAAAPARPNAPNVLEEHRDVQQNIKHSRYGHTIRLDTLPAARWEDLAQYLADGTPDVLHFAGRGTADDGPRFVTDDGGDAPADLDGRGPEDFPGVVPVRDSENPHGPVIVVPAAAWDAFVNSL